MRLIKLSIALLFSAAVFSGCDGITDLFKDGINVNLDKTATLTPENGIVKLSADESMIEGTDGALHLQVNADKKLALSPGVADEALVIKPLCDMYPNTVENPSLALQLENKSASSIREQAKVAVDGKEYDEVSLEAAPDNATLLVLSKDKMSSALSSALSVKPKEVDIKGITLATKAGSITVNSWLDIPFVYKKGDVISIDRTLSELGLSGVVLSSLGKSFKVEVEVDSYLPFAVTSQAEAGETVKAKLDTPLAAGTPSSAKRTNAVISVESSTAIDSISDAVIHLQLTAEDGARLTRDCKLVIHYKTLNIK